MKRLQVAVIALMAGFFVLLASGPAKAGTITFNTINNDFVDNGVTIQGHGLYAFQPVPTSTGWSWNYTGNFSNDRYGVWTGRDPVNPTQSDNWYRNNFVIAPNGYGGSNTTSGNGLTSYPGYEFMYFAFNLPANATNVALHFSNQNNADDRHVLSVNEYLIGGYKANLGSPVTVTTMLDGSGTHTVTFYGPGTTALINGSSQPVEADVTNPAFFHIGGDNFLRFWINNTNSTLTAPAHDHYSLGDPSFLRMAGYISYDTTAPVPVPPTVLLLGSGLLGLIALGRRKLASRR